MPQPISTDCRVVAQALCAGPVTTHVQAVVGQAARTGTCHIAVRFGSVLLYLEDREALDAFARAAARATNLGDAAFGPVEDEFTKADRRERHAVARGNAGRALLARGA